MNTASHISGVIHRILKQPTRGVVGLVDDLLALCNEQRLQLEWQTDRCRIRSNEGDWEELIDLPLRKSVFRSILARFAVLCNEFHPDSVSPYGGQGELSVGTNPSAVFLVVFTNTPTEQRLELTRDVYARKVGIETSVDQDEKMSGIDPVARRS